MAELCDTYGPVSLVSLAFEDVFSDFTVTQAFVYVSNMPPGEVASVSQTRGRAPFSLWTLETSGLKTSEPTVTIYSRLALVPCQQRDLQIFPTSS